MKMCYIVGAAPFEGSFAPQEGDLVVAADGGWQALQKRGIRPNIIVGDFDSSPKPEKQEGVTLICVPREKDDTDTALALKEGIRLGYTNFVFYGCLGGALDHSMANIQLLHDLASQGYQGCLCGDGVSAVVLCGGKTAHFDRLCGRISIFSLTDVSEGVTLKGLQYPLEKYRLTNQNPLGVSNKGMGGAATVSLDSGALLLLIYA